MMHYDDGKYMTLHIDAWDQVPAHETCISDPQRLRETTHHLMVLSKENRALHNNLLTSYFLIQWKTIAGSFAPPSCWRGLQVSKVRKVLPPQRASILALVPGFRSHGANMAPYYGLSVRARLLSSISAGPLHTPNHICSYCRDCSRVSSGRRCIQARRRMAY